MKSTKRKKRQVQTSVLGGVPFIFGLWVLFTKIMEITNQIKALFDKPNKLDINIKVPLETLYKTIISKNQYKFYMKAYKERYLYLLTGDRKDVFQKQGTFSSEDLVRIFEHYIDPVEKTDFLKKISPYLVYPVIKSYLTMADPVKKNILYNLDIILELFYMLWGKKS